MATLPPKTSETSFMHPAFHRNALALLAIPHRLYMASKLIMDPGASK